MLLEGHGQAIIIKNHLKDGFKGLWNGTDVQQLKGNFMDTLFIVYGKVPDAVRGFGVGRDKKRGFHFHDPVQGLKIGGHIIDKGYLVFVKGGPAAEAVCQEDGLVRCPHPDHLKKVAWQRDQLQF